MAYKAYPKAGFEKLGVEYKNTKVDLEKLKKAKGDKKQIANMEKKLDALGKQCAEKLEADIAGVAVNFKEHATKADKFAGAFVAEFKKAEQLLKTWSANANMLTNGRTYQALEQSVAATKQIVAQAKADADDYGKSWFEYRGLSPANPAYQLDSKYSKKFNDSVGKLMNAGKPVTAKISKMEVETKRADSLLDRAKSVQNQALGSEKAQLAEAKKLATETSTMINDMQNKKGENLKSIEQNNETINGLLNNKKTVWNEALVKNVQSLRQNAINNLKTLTARWRAIEKMTKEAKAMATSPNQEIQNNYKIAFNNQATAKQLVDDGTRLLKQIVPNVAKAEKLGKGKK